MSIGEETAVIVASLPGDKARSVLDFARFLAEEADERAWEERVAAAANSPRFGQRLAEVDREIAQGRAISLDLTQL